MKDKHIILIVVLVLLSIVGMILTLSFKLNTDVSDEFVSNEEMDNSFKIVNEATAMEIGDSLTLVAQKGSEIVSNSNLLFEVENPDIISVNADGVVEALSEGNSNIKITYGNEETNVIVYVQNIGTSNANALNGTSSVLVDVVLMWGQSNMMGAAGKYEIERTAISSKNGYKGIYSDIVNHTKSDSYVEAIKGKCSAWEYKETDSNHLVSVFDINSKIAKTTSSRGDNNSRFGENLVYNASTKKFKAGGTSGNNLYHSYGTNMIPYFAKTYCQRTGHNLVIVHTANPGKNILAFQPGAKKSDGKRYYLYESMVQKYKDAVSYLSNNGYIINNKYYIAYQGEENAKSTNYKNYYSNFMKVHNNLLSDLKLSFGAIVYSTRSPYSTANKTGIREVHNAQTNLVNKNANIILGSAFPYKQYVNNNKTPFCSNSIRYNGSIKSNSIHLTAAGLSEVGRQIAYGLSDSGKIK